MGDTLPFLVFILLEGKDDPFKTGATRQVTDNLLILEISKSLVGLWNEVCKSIKLVVNMDVIKK